jgi:ABC-type transporter Mla subunit MlaD
LRTDEADGITQDTRVVLQGLSIGRVSQVNPHQDPATSTLSFVATLSVRERFPDGNRLQLPVGTRALITPPPTVVGPSQVQLVMPPSSSEVQFLQAGDTLDAERSASVMNVLGDIAGQIRDELETMLQSTRELLAQTTSTIETTQGLLAETRPHVIQVLSRVDSSLQRTERILGLVEPKIGPMTDSVMAVLSSSHELLAELDSLATISTNIALENREDLSNAIDQLARASVILQHFADQISRRPLRFLTGVTPPPDSLAPPDTSRDQ